MKPPLLPPPRPVLFPLRSTDTATYSVQELPRHRRRVTIDHGPLRGVTPDMLLWWFQNIGGTTAYGDDVVPNYLVWHPIDHVRWELARSAPGGGAREGARFRIVEAFQGRPEFYIDVVERVEKLDATGIRLVHRVAGIPLVRLSHTWSACHDDSDYLSVMEVGAHAAALSAVNRYLTQRRFSLSMTHAWIRHNVEEVGMLEHILPDAFAGRDDAHLGLSGSGAVSAHRP